MTVKDFAKQFLKENPGNRIGYLAKIINYYWIRFQVWLKISLFQILLHWRWRMMLTWMFGLVPKAQYSFHTDPSIMRLCQVSGSKYIVLYPANILIISPQPYSCYSIQVNRSSGCGYWWISWIYESWRIYHDSKPGKCCTYHRSLAFFVTLEFRDKFSQLAFGENNLLRSTKRGLEKWKP